MLGWFKKRPRQLEPEHKWVVSVDDDLISVCDQSGLTKSVAKGDLSRVAIETNDSGPWGADVWWLLFDGCDQLICAFPQGATGEGAVVEYVCALPAFDYAEMIRAMASTDNAVFGVWRKQP